MRLNAPTSDPGSRVRASFVLALLSLAPFAGCGKGTVDVDARVQLDGQPLEGASVTLIGFGDTRNRPATGISDVQGKVRFTTFEPDDGVLPGEYKVLISKMPKSVEEEFQNIDPSDIKAYERKMMRERSANVPYTPSVLPRIYLNSAATPLSLKVPPDKQPVVFDLDSSADKRK
jgi:hypothetical protein